MRVKFCWECGHKLWGNHRVKKMIDGEIRTLHKSCGKLYSQPEIEKSKREEAERRG